MLRTTDEIFVVIPLCNEKRHIVSVVKDMAKHKLPIVVVDDGSVDGSSEVLKNSRIKNLTLLRHKINLGKGAAMKTGSQFAFANGASAVIFADADGQHKGSDLPLFIEALKSGDFDVVFGSRNLNKKAPLVRYLGNKFASVVSGILFGTHITDAICGFRAITKRGYQKINWQSTGYGVEMEMVARVGKFGVRYCEVPVKAVYYDKVKGVTLLDALAILGEVFKWKLTIK